MWTMAIRPGFWEPDGFAWWPPELPNDKINLPHDKVKSQPHKSLKISQKRPDINIIHHHHWIENS